MHWTRICKAAQSSAQLYKEKCFPIDLKEAVIKLRSMLKIEIHESLRKQDYIEVDLPVLTSTLMDGSEHHFYITHPDANCVGMAEGTFFNTSVQLRPSVESHIESAAHAFRKVYSMGACFDARNSPYEQQLLECEESFVMGEEGLQYLLEQNHQFVRHCMEFVSNLDGFKKFQKHRIMLEVTCDALRKDPIQITYDEVIEFLSTRPLSETRHLYKYGDILKSRAIKALETKFQNQPYYITHFPLSHQSLLAAQNKQKVLNFNLMLPTVGCISCGGVKESDPKSLLRKMRDLQVQEYYKWHMELRKWGTAPTGGYQIFYDKLIQFIFGEPLICDSQVFSTLNKSS